MSKRRTKKTKSTKASRHLAYHKVRARTERMNMSVRLAFCILVLMGSLAFLVTAWQPFKDLKYAKVNLAENKEREDVEVRKFDGKQRELENLQHHR